MLISTLNCEMWPNFSYRGVRSVQLLLLMIFSSENVGFLPPYAGIAGIGPAYPPPYIAKSRRINSVKTRNNNNTMKLCIGLLVCMESFLDYY